MSTQGAGQPDYNPCNYWPYHWPAWYAWNTDPNYDVWITERQQAMPKTFEPQLLRLLNKLAQYMTKHSATLRSTWGVGSGTDTLFLNFQTALVALLGALGAYHETP